MMNWTLKKFWERSVFKKFCSSEFLACLIKGQVVPIRIEEKLFYNSTYGFMCTYVAHMYVYARTTSRFAGLSMSVPL